MTRLVTSGWELNDINMDPVGLLIGGRATAGGASTPAFQQAVVRSGAWAGVCATTVGGVSTASRWFVRPTTVASHNYWYRCYFRFPALPASSIFILAVAQGATIVKVAALNSDGTLTGLNGGVSAALLPDTWYRLEFEFSTDASNNWVYQSARLNGTSFDTGSGTTTLVAGLNNIYWGLIETPAGLPASFTCYMDDFGINDDTGAAQNTWLGDGKVVLLTPVSDNARGANWVAGAGATTGLSAAIDNTPPVGVALASATNTSQIKNVSKDTTGNYDANLATYASAGIEPWDAVNVVVPMWNIGGLGNSMAILLVSNPIGNGGVETVPVFSSLAVGAYPSNWPWFSPVAQWVQDPTVAVATSPVIRVGKRVSSTNDSECDAMSLYVDYTPGVAPTYDAVQREEHSDPWSLQVIGQAVKRSAFFCLGEKWERHRSGLVVPA